MSRAYANNSAKTEKQSQRDAKPTAAQRAGSDILANVDLLLSMQSAAGNQATQSTMQRKQRDVATTGRMPLEVQHQMEEALGGDFSDVTIYPNSDKATNVGALAYTQGTEIHFAPGQYNPDSYEGKELLGHELTHVMQQKAGRVTPTGKIGRDTLINDDQGLEMEAEQMGKKAALAATSSAEPIQRAVDKVGAAPTAHSNKSLIIQRTI